jgi:hypothetical protein
VHGVALILLDRRVALQDGLVKRTIANKAVMSTLQPARSVVLQPHGYFSLGNHCVLCGRTFGCKRFFEGRGCAGSGASVCPAY